MAGCEENSMIVKRGNRYGARIYRAGKQEWVGTYRTLKEARAAEHHAVAQARPANEETVAEFVERWKRDFPRPRASTNSHNAYMVKPLVRDFGSTKMSGISRRRAREWARSHRASVPAVRALYNDALDEECVTTNPFANLRLDQGRGRRDLDVPSEPEVHDLADKALRVFGSYGPTFRACVLFAAYVGLRPAELFMLEWSDLSDDEVHIRRSLGSTGEVTRLRTARRGASSCRLRHVTRSVPCRAALTAPTSSRHLRGSGSPRHRTTTTGDCCVPRPAGRRWRSTSCDISLAPTCWRWA